MPGDARTIDAAGVELTPEEVENLPPRLRAIAYRYAPALREREAGATREDDRDSEG